MKYRYQTTPYRHQVAALKDVVKGFRERGSHALLMEPRTGKTKVAVDAVSLFHQAGLLDRVLVVCPISAIGVWQNEIALHCPFPYRIVVWDKDGRKTDGLPPWGNGKLTFVLINYDAFSTPGAKLPSGKRSRSRGGRFEMKKAFLRWQPHCIILDESHRIKSPRARKTTMLWILGPIADYRLILTGTPLTKKKRVYDIWSQWKFLNPESPLVRNLTLGDFKKRFGVWTNRNGYPQWLRHRNMGALRTKLHAESFAITRAECFDLPPRRNQIIPITLTGHNADLYDEMAETMVARIKTGEITEAPIKIVQTLRLSQLTSGIAKTAPTPAHPEGRLLRVGKDKLIVLEELLTDWFEADEHVVIGARWRADIQAIGELGRKLKVPVFQVHGGIKQRDRMTHHVEPFNRTEGAAMFIMQPAAGSEAIDLSSSATFVWFSLTNSWVNFTQGEDRIALSARGTVYHYLIAQGSDQVMYDSLMEDGDLARAVTESPDRLLRNYKRPWTPRERRERG